MAGRRRLAVVQVQATAVLAAFEDALAQMSEKALLCRDIGHAWTGYKAERTEFGGWEQTMRCVHGCGTTKVRLLNADGYILKAKMAYNPDSNYVMKGVGRANMEMRASMRVASIGRRI